MYRSSPLRSTFNTNVFTGSGMCKVCTGTRGKGVVTGSPTYIYCIYITTLELNWYFSAQKMLGQKLFLVLSSYTWMRCKATQHRHELLGHYLAPNKNSWLQILPPKTKHDKPRLQVRSLLVYLFPKKTTECPVQKTGLKTFHYLVT